MKLEQLQVLRNKEGIYFLFSKENEICYIGQSYNMYIRLLEHIIEAKKEFEYFKAIEIKDCDFRELMENYLIRHYQDFTLLYNKIVIPGNFEYYYMTLPSSLRNKYNYEEFINCREFIDKHLKNVNKNSIFNYKEEYIKSIL